MVRFGLLGQKQVVDAINHYFVPVQIDTTSGLPEDVPGLWLHRRYYEGVPWSRASFGMESVLDPEGKLLLSVPPHKHDAVDPDRATRLDQRVIAEMFQEMIEDGLKRFARIRAHARGSAAEAEEIRRVVAEVEADARMPNHCMLDLHACTAHTLAALGTDLEEFKDKLSGVLISREPEVLRQAAESLGHYATRSEEFRTGEVAPYVGNRMAELLDDPDAGVRRSAAVALYQLGGQPVPSVEDAELVASARDLRDASGGL